MSAPTPHKQLVARRRPAPAWMLWANPIIRRYARSRLRPQGFGVILLITLLSAGFLFFMFRSSALYRAGMAPIDAERTPLIALLVLQSIILFFLGTGQVAGAMTAEADEGVLDYQRLAPMTPLAKVLGYLFGLPIREYALFLATTPFTIWCVWRGEVPPGVALQLYAVFLTSAILYHLTGLVAGTVVKNRRWAFLASMGIVFLLYTVIPQVARFGLVYFKYLTIQPVFQEALPALLPRDAGAAMETVQRLLPSARFFNLDLPQAVFTLLSQALLILTAIVMLWRRWRRAESHLLGKGWAVGLFGWIQVVLLGNAIPLLDSGSVFPSREFNRRLGRFGNDLWQPDPTEAIAMVGAFGLVTLLLLCTLTLMVTPDADGQIRGWRRARKLERRSLSPLSDPATAFWSVALMVAAGTLGWFVFAREIIGSRWFPGWEVSPVMPAAFALVLCGGGFGFHALLEAKGFRTVGLVAILLGAVPLMLGTIAAAISDRFAAPATWLIGLSPASGPLYAAASTMREGELPLEIARALPRAFWFWQGVIALAAVWLIGKLVAARRAIARQVEPS